MSTANGCRGFATARRAWPLLALAGLLGCQAFPDVRGDRVQKPAKPAKSSSVAKPVDRAPETLDRSTIEPETPVETPAIEPRDLPALPTTMPEPIAKPEQTPLLDSAFDGSNAFRRLLLDHLDVPVENRAEARPAKTDPPAKSEAIDETPVPTLETTPVEPIETKKDIPKPQADPPREAIPVENPATIPPVVKKDESVERAARPIEPAFEIGELKLCRRVRGFGDYEAVAPSLRTGAPIILYCELAGVTFEPVNSRYRSRIQATLELIPENTGAPVWSRGLADAIDVCQHPRRDYFVGYLVHIPREFPAGRYHLRLRQVDLLSRQTAERAIPVVIHH